MKSLYWGLTFAVKMNSAVPKTEEYAGLVPRIGHTRGFLTSPSWLVTRKEDWPHTLQGASLLLEVQCQLWAFRELIWILLSTLTSMGTCHLKRCPTQFCQPHSPRQAAGSLQRTEDSPSHQPNPPHPPPHKQEDETHRPAPASSTSPDPPPAPGFHGAVHAEPRFLTPTPPQPLPNKTILADFLFMVMT